MLNGDGSRLALFDLRQDGCFFDPTGEQVVVIGVADLQCFFASLDQCFEAPIGRKILYAATDAEELVLQSETFSIPRWLGKKRVLRDMNQRFLSMGWGVLEPSAIKYPIHDALSVGFALAHHEHSTGLRWNIEWSQQTSEHIRLAFQSKPQTMHPAARPEISGWGQHVSSNATGLQTVLDIDERPYGFFVGDQRSAFLPVVFFHILADQLRGRQQSTTGHAQAELTFSGHVANADLFVTFASAAKRMFQDSTTPVFVRHDLDWQELLAHRLTNFGFGSVEVEESVVGGGKATVFSVQSSIPAVVCGLLMGMWERCHGSRCKADVFIYPDKLQLSIKKPEVDY